MARNAAQFPHAFKGKKRERMTRSSRSSLSGATTRRAKKRGRGDVGERDSLWGLVVNDNDDVCFKHILPRLNSNDVKFLYEVNSETRKLIKRSSRESDLKGTFKARQMSSISTLEFAWEHYGMIT